MKSLYAILLTVFLAAVVFSVLLSMPLSLDMHCPFSTGCVSTVEHLDHWQNAFASILLGTFLFAAGLGVIAHMLLPALVPLHTQRLRHMRRHPRRPTLLQELFSSGILNRKEYLIAR